MIKKIFSALVVVLFATSMMAQTGLTCEDPIPVDSNYVGSVPGEGYYWYSATTYDLPLRMVFVPESDNCAWGPELSIDFTCVPGVYADHKLDSVIKSASAWDISMPIEFLCEKSLVDGKYVFDLSVDKRYREQLAECGITYNVTAYVQVYFPEAGEIRFRPDTVFSSCMDNAHVVALGDTIDVLPNDSDRIFLLPYPEWRQDSIRFVWNGDDAARVWLATQECDFTPVTTSAYVWNYYDLTKDKAYKLMPSDIEAAIKANNAGGLFYGKILSKSSGKLVVEKVPVTPPAGNATLLQYGKTVHVEANDSDALFAIPKTWSQATKFVPSESCILTTQLSNNYTFENATGYYVSDFEAFTLDNELASYMTSTELTSLIRKRKDDYTYVRFITNKAVNITPMIWDNVSPCFDISYAINKNELLAITSSSSSNYYRFRYEDYKGYDLTINWTGSSKLNVYVGDTCSYALSSSNSHVLYYKSINRKSSFVIDAATLDSWASGVDPDGYLYVRLSAGNGNVTFMTDKPEPSTSPCVLGSTELKLNSVVNINLASAFTVYRIDYNAWMQQAVTLEWTGVEPLHTFVAETCEFALAPYNRYVHAYVPVPAQGDWVLDMNALAPYVDEDGYLYIRFLTEFEGTLKVGR